MQGYMPGQLYNLNSKYGDKDALLALLADLNAAGLKSIADIVISKSTRLQHAAGPAGPQHMFDLEAGKCVQKRAWILCDGAGRHHL